MDPPAAFDIKSNRQRGRRTSQADNSAFVMTSEARQMIRSQLVSPAAREQYIDNYSNDDETNNIEH